MNYKIDSEYLYDMQENFVAHHSIKYYYSLLNLYCIIWVKLREKHQDSTLGLYQMSVVYKTAGNFKKAIECLQKLLEEDPDIVSVQYNLGLSYLGISGIEKAMAAFEKVLTLDPDHRGALDQLGMLKNDQDMFYTYGVEAMNEGSSTNEIIANYHVGQAHKGFAMIDKAFKFFKENIKK